MLSKFCNKKKDSFGLINLQIEHEDKLITKTIMFAYSSPYSTFIEYDFKCRDINNKWNYSSKFKSFEKFAWTLHNGNHLYMTGGVSSS